MKIFAISLSGLLAVLIVAGCNPVGMDETRCYVTGVVWTDSLENTKAQGVGIIVSGAQNSYSTETNANGLFWIEIQFYPEQLLEGGGIGGSTGSVEVGIQAIDEFGNIYYYGGDEEYLFTIFGGDTLTLYDINLDMFEQ
jgi:hypothetical protein